MGLGLRAPADELSGGGRGGQADLGTKGGIGLRLLEGSRSCQVVQVARVGRKQWGRGRPEQPFPRGCWGCGDCEEQCPGLCREGEASVPLLFPRLPPPPACCRSHIRSILVNATCPNVTNPRIPPLEHRPGLSRWLHHRDWPHIRPLVVPAGARAGCETAAPASPLFPNVAAAPLLPSTAQSASPPRDQRPLCSVLRVCKAPVLARV